MKFSSFNLVIAAFAMLCVSACANNETSSNTHADKAAPSHWDYNNTDWAAEGYTDCGGTIQSPINIVTANTIKAILPDVKFNYSEFPENIIDNGHTVQVNLNGNSASNNITYNGATYNLKQFHFHIASEHRVDSVQTAMELHLVHQNEQSGAYIVVGLMMELSPVDNPVIEKLWSSLPKEKGKELATNTKLNINDLLPTSRLYYTYTGSLTAPPCSQGLNWIVMKERIKISAAQVAKFKAIYSNNSRPTQPLNNRLVYEDFVPAVKEK